VSVVAAVAHAAVAHAASAPAAFAQAVAAVASPTTSPGSSPSSTVSPSATVSAALAKRVSSGDIGPGWVAFSLVVAMGVALALLMRSMRHQVRRISFVEEPDPRDAGRPARPVWPTRPPETPPPPRRR